MKFVLFVTTFLMANAYAGPREDFIDAVKGQCKKSEDEAVALATPGKQGNIFLYMACNAKYYEVAADCKIACIDKSSKIGQ